MRVGASMFFTEYSMTPAALGRALEERGFDSVWAPEHSNILHNPAVCFVSDHYDEDWTRLGWVMLRGNAEVLSDGREHDMAQALLKTRYPQLAAMDITDLPVIALRITHATDWGAV